MIESIIELKLNNIKSIINAVRFSDQMSRKVLSNILGLSFATVSNICNSLVEHGILLEDISNGEKTVGRSTKYLSFNKNRYNIVGISLEETGTVRFCLSNLKNEIISQQKMSYSANTNIERFVDEIAKMYFNFIKNLKINEDVIIGIGMAIPAIFNQLNENIVASEIPLLEDQPLKRFFESRFRKKVFIDNDANLCVVSINNMLESENIIYIFINEGLGIGTLQNGKVLRGARGFASEICHMPFGVLDKRCWLCGSNDCLQTDISVSGFVKKYSLAKGVDAKWDEFIDALRRNDEAALVVAKENAHILGKAISSIVNLLDSERIIIGGIPQELFNELESYVNNEVNTRKIVKTMPDFRIEFDDASYENIICGATEAVFNNWSPQI